MSEQSTGATPIPPTIGRKLWLFTEQGDLSPELQRLGVARDPEWRTPFDATIVHITPRKPDAPYDYITVAAHDHAGTPFTLHVPLRQAGDAQPDARTWAEWMPYQQGQAKKEPAVRMPFFQMTPEQVARWDEMYADDMRRNVEFAERFLKKRNGRTYSDGTTATGPGPLPAEKPQSAGMLSFSGALKVLKAGGRVSREGWNGKGLWLEIQQPDAKSKMTLPYIFLSYPAYEPTMTPGARVPWLASQTDLLSDDWCVVAH